MLAAWLVGAAAPSRAPGPTAEMAVQHPAEPDRQALALLAETERIRERLDVGAAVRPVTRNPFRFAAPPLRPREETRVAAPAPAVSQRAVPLALLGVAEEAPGTVDPGRTAILSFAGDLLLVKEGDPVGARYRVTRIGPESVELEDLVDAGAVRVALP